jgi:hypothetical protein
MKYKFMARENYLNGQHLNWDISNLASGKVLEKVYNGGYLKALQTALGKEFAYFRCEILVSGKIMSLKINKEFLVKHEDRI